MFDGVLRPLDQIKAVSGGIYIPRGIDVPALPRDVQWDFLPQTDIKVCQSLHSNRVHDVAILTCPLAF